MERNTVYTSEHHAVQYLNAPIRLQDYGVGIFESAPTKSALKKAIKRGCVTVNGSPATTATILNGGEKIELSVSLEHQSTPRFDLDLRVLFEDDYLAVIHKPAGISVSGNRLKTIAHALKWNIRRSFQSDAAPPQPVHRLDYPTTGNLLIGKTSRSIRALNRLFAEKKIRKTYYAITIGDMQPEGEITADIDGKSASSGYTVIDSVASTRFGRLNLIELIPQTGRRHQLRKHLAMIGNPILGDKEYGIKDLILRGKGLYLHACGLKFTHPLTDETVMINNPLPGKFTKIFPEQ